jgi:uncharacterized protein (DUF305 family)
VKRFPIAVVVTSLLVLAACSSTTPETKVTVPATGVLPTESETSKAAVSGAFNAADVVFLQMMIPHHEQGVEMVRLAEKQATRTEVKDLVAAIKVTQADEVKDMASWLQQWGQSTTAGAHANLGGMPATSPEIIADLAKSTGPEFETKFLNLFTGHQGAAVEMARTELKDGGNQPVKQLADRIVRSRTGQIQQMLTLLSRQ